MSERSIAATLWLLAGGCAELPLDPPPAVEHVVFDPAGGHIPLPNDLARDVDARRLALPIDEGMSLAEQAVRTALNEQDAWSSVSALSFDLSAPVDPETLTADTVQVWEWGEQPVPVDGVAIVPDDDGLQVEVMPPREGWALGGRYVALVVGGEAGVHAASGVPLGPDAAFWFLRLTTPLDAHPDAFPGADRAEQQETADALEAVRQELQPAFALAEAVGVPRDTLAALWTFSITRRPELAMDADSQRMPLPFDLLIDPETGLVDLPPGPEDDALELDAKAVASTFRGFAVSANLHAELTAPVDPTTVGEQTVQLYDLTHTPVQVPAAVSVWAEHGRCGAQDTDCIYLVVDPEPLPLEPGARFAVVVRPGITGLDGEPLAPMAIGQLLRSPHPLLDGEHSTIGSVDDADAARIEALRASLDALLDSLGRDTVVTAWPFTTLDPLEDLRADVAIAQTLAYDASPTVTERGPPTDLFSEDDPISDLFPGLVNPAEPFYLPRIDGVAEVIEGTIPVPIHLHPESRRWQEPPVIDDVHFIATLPEGVPAGQEIPVVIFGHAVVTDRRFLLTIAGALAEQGFAAVSIDFPYHGERTACVDASLVAVPNFFPEDLRPLVGFTDTMIWLPPCASEDATCSPTGQCVGPDGQVEPFNAFPIVDIQPAAGAAFLDVHDLPHIPDHFRQSLVDLGALRYSLQSADWEGVLGQAIRTDQFLYAGQSLGAIIGAVYVVSDPAIARAVLNVPGANLVSLFDDSDFFGPQMDDYLASIEVERGTWEEERLLAVARWILDSVDPHTVAHGYAEEAERLDAVIQIDRINDQLGDIVIPNHTTDTLQQASGMPMVEYPSLLHGDLVVPLVGDQMLADLAEMLAEGGL